MAGVPAAVAPVVSAPVAAAADAAAPAMGDLFSTYNAKGADNGLFAPAALAGFQPSDDALAAWNAQHHAVDMATAQQLRMPDAWQPPSTAKAGSGFGGGVYGAGRIPASQTLGDPLGMVDPAALQAAAQGGSYDVGARRAAIAQRLADNAAAQAAYVPPPADPWAMYRMTGY
jgi:hypothetical protein